MDNAGIKRLLGDIADLLEIKGENPFKIRAYRNAADIAGNHPHDLAALDADGLREIPGIGKDLAARIVEIGRTGDCAYRQELAAEFPPSILDLMHLQGVGPKTAAMLFRELKIQTLADLEQAAIHGRIRRLKGMGPKKEALIIKALEERKRHSGRHLLSTSHEVAAALVAHLQPFAPDAILTPVGSVRRGCETCGDIDILATGGDHSLMDALIHYHGVERVLSHGDTSSSVLLRDGFQADLRLVKPECRGAAMQYFTGSKAHNVQLRDRALNRGLKLNEYGLFKAGDDTRLAGTAEEEIYEALGLAWIPPELREARGEIEAAEARTLPVLLTDRQLRGGIHMHTTETDGRDTLQAMVDAAAEAGLEYIAITDHSQALAMANGLNETRCLAHAARIRALDGHRGLRVLAGIECDIRADGTMDLADDCLAALDIVIASVHSAFNQDKAQMTARLLRAIEHPHVDVLGHLTGRMLLRRSAYPLDFETIVTAAAKYQVAIEINSQAYRLDINDVQARMAHQRGVPIVISSDAHSRGELAVTRWGTIMARRAWLQPGDVLNSRPFDDFRLQLRRNRS